MSDSLTFSRRSGLSYLDSVRLRAGEDRCRAVFRDILRRNPRRAAAMLNDRLLSFPCLYILRGQAMDARVYKLLSLRDKIALRTIEQVKKPGEKAKCGREKSDPAHSALKWVFVTGSANEIPEDDYEEVIDKAAAALLITYKDKDILKGTADLIFRRGREGRNNHDLIWLLFQVRDAEVLKLIAQRLRSPDRCDADLACELLNLDEKGLDYGKSGEELHSAFIRWLEENDPYLYFTDESFQYSSKPAFSAVDMERKYLHKGLRTYEKEPLVPEDDDEAGCLEVFRQLGDGEQRALSEYSHSIHADGAGYWRRWLHLPPEEQLRAAAAGREVYL